MEARQIINNTDKVAAEEVAEVVAEEVALITTTATIIAINHISGNNRCNTIHSKTATSHTIAIGINRIRIHSNNVLATITTTHMVVITVAAIGVKNTQCLVLIDEAAKVASFLDSEIEYVVFIAHTMCSVSVYFESYNIIQFEDSLNHFFLFANMRNGTQLLSARAYVQKR